MGVRPGLYLWGLAELLRGVELNREASKRVRLLAMWVTEGIEDDVVSLIAVGLGALGSLLSKQGSIDDFGSWRGVMPVVQGLKLGS